MPMLPFRFSRVEHWLRSPSPTLGRDNDDVLEELGYPRSAIERWHEVGRLGAVPAGLER